MPLFQNRLISAACLVFGLVLPYPSAAAPCKKVFHRNRSSLASLPEVRTLYRSLKIREVQKMQRDLEQNPLEYSDRNFNLASLSSQLAESSLPTPLRELLQRKHHFSESEFYQLFNRYRRPLLKYSEAVSNAVHEALSTLGFETQVLEPGSVGGYQRGYVVEVLETPHGFVEKLRSGQKKKTLPHILIDPLLDVQVSDTKGAYNRRLRGILLPASAFVRSRRIRFSYVTLLHETAHHLLAELLSEKKLSPYNVDLVSQRGTINIFGYENEVSFQEAFTYHLGLMFRGGQERVLEAMRLKEIALEMKRIADLHRRGVLQLRHLDLTPQERVILFDQKRGIKITVNGYFRSLRISESEFLDQMFKSIDDRADFHLRFAESVRDETRYFNSP